MGGVIDFNTDCPWQLYTFSLVHILAGLCMYVFDACRLVSQDGVSCIESEIVMSCIVGFSMLYVGVLWGIITYQNKHDNGKITRLSNMGINGATALLVSVIFAGNASYGGLENSWMHIGDMLTMIILLGILVSRVSQPGELDDTLRPHCTFTADSLTSLMTTSFYRCRMGSKSSVGR